MHLHACPTEPHLPARAYCVYGMSHLAVHPGAATLEEARRASHGWQGVYVHAYLPARGQRPGSLRRGQLMQALQSNTCQNAPLSLSVTAVSACSKGGHPVHSLTTRIIVSGGCRHEQRHQEAHGEHTAAADVSCARSRGSVPATGDACRGHRSANVEQR